eukprot:ANDGO_05566.mRNA.1 hypothetical protein DICPUDRAFT_151404
MACLIDLRVFGYKESSCADSERPRHARGAQVVRTMYKVLVCPCAIPWYCCELFAIAFLEECGKHGKATALFDTWSAMWNPFACGANADGCSVTGTSVERQAAVDALGWMFAPPPSQDSMAAPGAAGETASSAVQHSSPSVHPRSSSVATDIETPHERECPSTVVQKNDGECCEKKLDEDRNEDEEEVEEHADCNEDLDDSCRICFENKINTVIDDCGHTVICLKCATSGLRLCPICRSKIKSIVCLRDETFKIEGPETE